MSTPCANCRISRLECVYNIAPQKRGPKRKRNVTTQPTFRVSDGESMRQAGATVHQSDARLSNTTFRSYDLQVSLTGAPSSAARNLQPSSQIHQQPDLALHGIADQCITLYMNYLFPISPTIHEPSIRAMVPLLQGNGGEDMAVLRSRTLLTALCAVTALTLPVSVFPMREQIGRQFLTASRETLKSHEDYGWWNNLYGTHRLRADLILFLKILRI